MRRAAQILGISQVIQQDFNDGHLAESRQESSAFLMRTIGQTAPDLIVSYDLSGLDGHADHVTCAEIVISLKRTQFPAITLWCATLPPRLVTLLHMARQLPKNPEADRRRGAPTARVFIGTDVVSKIRAWYAYRSQRGSIARGWGRALPVWFAVSMLQFEYFAEVTQS